MPEVSITSSEGWGSRLKNSLGGILVGLVLSAGACIGLWINEGSAVKRYQDLNFAKDNVVSVSSDSVAAENEGKAIHFTGTTVAGNTPRDPQFGVAAEGALKLQRSVEMFQWRESESSETRKKMGGGTETVTTYSYDTGWSSRAETFENSDRPAEVKNPGPLPYPSATQAASPITVGAFTLSDGLVGRLNQYQPLAVASLDGIPDEIKETAKLHDGGIYLGADPANPAVGDVRVTFSSVAPGAVSIVSQQTGDTLRPFPAKNGTVELLQTGNHDAEAMFAKAVSDRKMMTWIFRLVGFIAMAIGFNLLVRPLVVLADVVPFLGNIVGAGVGFIMTLLAALVSFVIIAIAWVAARPIIGISLLLVAGVIVFLIFKKTRGAKPPALQPAAAGGDGGPPPLA